MNQNSALRILFLESNRRDAELVAERLKTEGITGELMVVTDRAAFEMALAERVDLILANVTVPCFNALDGLTLAHEQHPEVPFLFVSGAVGDDPLIELLTPSATDYVLKTRIKHLGPAVRRALDEAHARAERNRVVAELKENEARLQATFEYAAVGKAHLSPDGRWLRINHRLGQMLGCEPATLIGQPWLVQIDPADQPMLGARWQQLLSGASFETELRLYGPARSLIWCHLALWAGCSRMGAVQYLSATFVDISERKRSEEALRQSEQRLRLAEQIGRIGTFDWDIATDTVHWSAEVAALYGLPVQMFESSINTWHELIYPEDRTALEQRVEQALETSRFEAEWRVLWPDGSVHWLAGRAVVEQDEAGQPCKMLGVNIDITERKQAEEQQRRAAQHDPLTGLHNRALFYESATHLLPGMRRAGHMAAVLFIDLDRFKPINDGYGHAVGDQVLKEVARRLSAGVRQLDLVGRIGGDEFVVVLSQIHSGDDAAHVATHILERLNQPYRTDVGELQVTPSIGISLFPADGDSVDELIKNADKAMYTVKQNGKNNVQFYSSNLDAPTRW
ncbi:MAG: diguanylate cyclase [Leptothrix sp. (in: b-proteobacteria)]